MAGSDGAGRRRGRRVGLVGVARAGAAEVDRMVDLVVAVVVHPVGARRRWGVLPVVHSTCSAGAAEALPSKDDATRLAVPEPEMTTAIALPDTQPARFTISCTTPDRSGVCCAGPRLPLDQAGRLPHHRGRGLRSTAHRRARRGERGGVVGGLAVDGHRDRRGGRPVGGELDVGLGDRRPRPNGDPGEPQPDGLPGRVVQQFQVAAGQPGRVGALFRVVRAGLHREHSAVGLGGRSDDAQADRR